MPIANIRRQEAWRIEVPSRWRDYRWRDYPCDDYFMSPLAIDGNWDEPGQSWLIEPSERVEEDVEAGFLQVGRAGVGRLFEGQCSSGPRGC